MGKLRQLGIAVLAAALPLTGCISSKQLIGPSGQPAYAISCNGGPNSWNDCFERAGEICGAKGYELLERNGEVVSAIGGSANGFAGGTGLRRSMMVACKA